MQIKYNIQQIQYDNNVDSLTTSYYSEYHGHLIRTQHVVNELKILPIIIMRPTIYLIGDSSMDKYWLPNNRMRKNKWMKISMDLNV